MIRPLYILFAVAAAIIVVKLLFKVSRRIGLQWVLTLLFAFALCGIMLLAGGRGSRPYIMGLETHGPFPASPARVPPLPSSDQFSAMDDARVDYEVAHADVRDGITHAEYSSDGHQNQGKVHAGASKSVVTRFRKAVARYGQGADGGGIVWTLVMGAAIAIFLYLAYLFLDAGTRGHFTWQLRIISVLAFVGICVAIAALRDGL